MADSIPLKTDSLDAIPKNMHSLYSEVDGGGYEFQVPESLLRAKNHEKEKRQEARAEIDGLKKQMSDLASKYESADIARQKAEAEKTGNWEALETSFNEKAAGLESTYKAQLGERDSIIQNLTVEQAATALSAKLFGEDAETLSHVVKGRLQCVIEDGKAATRVLDAKGQPSALSLDELHDEIYNDKRYSRFVVGSNASGGGANGSSGNGRGAAHKKLSDMTATEEARFANENPVQYAQMIGQQ